jgi:transcriptional regulator with XRE-family HTH domain
MASTPFKRPAVRVMTLTQRVTAAVCYGTILVMSGHPGSHFGRQLKKERVMRGWSLDDLARVTGINAAHLSRIENGKRPPTEKTALAIDKALPERKGWFYEYWGDLQEWSEVPSWFKPWSDIEITTATIRSWLPEVIDGLLQTADYARAQMSLYPDITEERLAERVANRIARQNRVLFREDPPKAHFLIDVTALQRIPPAAKDGQLRHLLDVAALPNVTLQVVPVCWHSGMSAGILLADGAAYTESHIGGQVYGDSQSVSSLASRFASIAAESMRASESAALIREMIQRDRLAKVQLLRRSVQRLRRTGR